MKVNKVTLAIAKKTIKISNTVIQFLTAYRGIYKYIYVNPENIL